MRGGSLIQYPSNRYYQGKGVLQGLGAEARLLGTRALIVAEKTLWDKTGQLVTDSLQKSGIQWAWYEFHGICCPEQYKAASLFAAENGCDLAIGIGGGRALDTAKIASDLSDIRCITVPTSAATCAATAWLAVHYREDGAMIGNYWPKYAPFATFADLDLILESCPIRYNLAGAVDAMAKYPEISYNIQKGTVYQRNAFSRSAAEVARSMFDYLIEHAPHLSDAAPDIQEDIIAYSLNIAGLTSALACGGKQAAVSHQLYAYVCESAPQITQHYLHGEIVGASLVYQLKLIGETDSRIARFQQFLRDNHLPCNLKQLGLPDDQASSDRLFEYLRQKLPVESDREMEHLQQLKASLYEEE